MSRPREASRFASVARADGLRAGLACLNSRTPHRCTAVYRYVLEAVAPMVYAALAAPASASSGQRGLTSKA